MAKPYHIIEPGSKFGRKIGFTKTRFDGWLWRDGDRVKISLIFSKQPGRGHLKELFSRIEAMGLRVAVPTPLHPMQEILEKWGYEPSYEDAVVVGDIETVEVWMKPDRGEEVEAKDVVAA